MAATVRWQVRTRSYDDEKMGTWKSADGQHPLKANVVSTKISAGEKTLRKNDAVSVEVMDPLSRMAQESHQLGVPVETDPLSALFLADPLPLEAPKTRSGSLATKSQVAGLRKVSQLTPADELWFSKRHHVLNTYTTREKLAIRTAVLSAKDNIKEVVIQAEKLKVTDRVQQRLEELNDFDETTKTECVSLSVEEYLAKIADVNSMLTAAWRDEQRVKAVRLAIQCAKMLSDTSVIEFYPSKFVLITDILDNFGNLVFDRLRAKAESTGRSLPDDFAAADVPNAAKETTLNWFYKLASIRELLPRIYMQAAILQSLRFISDKSLDDWLGELMMMTRGIANPLVSIYTSAYLCRVGLRAYFLRKAFGKSSRANSGYQNGSLAEYQGGVFSQLGSCLPTYLRKCIDDFLLISRQMTRLNFDRLPKDDNITLTGYVRLFIPGMEWIFQCISSFADNSNASSLLASEILQASDGHPNSDLIIHCLLSTFPSSFTSEHGHTLALAISSLKRPDIPKWQLFRELGMALLCSDPLYADRKRIFDLAWAGLSEKSHHSEDNQPRDVLQWAEVWLEYSARFLDLDDADAVLSLVIETCEKSKQSLESLHYTLHSTLAKFVQAVKDFERLFTYENFLKFLDCFNAKSSAKADACQLIVEAYRKTPSKIITDQLFIDSLVFLCKTWHDNSVSYHTSPDVARQIAKSVNAFISRVDFGRDFEKLLQFYMECRSTFVYLEDTIAHLIVLVNRAVMNVSAIVKMRHTKRTLNFSKASVAFCYITIPSIDDALRQVRLSLLTGQTALVNGCIGQSEALFKLAVITLPDVPISVVGTDGRQHPTDVQFAEVVAQLCSALIPLPDCPDTTALYVWQGLINATLRYDWQGASGIPTSHPPNVMSSGCPKIDALLSILHALGSLSQPKYIYHVENVDANDVLYGGDARFLARLNELAAEVLSELVIDIENRAMAVLPPKRVSSHAVTTHQNLVAYIGSSLLPILDIIGNDECLSLANKLWELGGQNNKRLLKLKSTIYAKDSSVASRLFPSTTN